jgi:CelD/BcsL family acetyltransferase involved in cellulose biosynthesis
LGDVETFILTPSPDQVPELLAEVFRVEAAGWKGSAGTALAADPLRRAFFEHYCDAEARAGRLRICLLRIAGRAAAAQIAIQTSTRFSLLRAGYDEEFARTSPGNLLTRESIRHAALAGLATYEFNGDIEPWTRLWTEDALACCSIRIYPFSLSGAVAFLAQAAKSFFERVTKR